MLLIQSIYIDNFKKLTSATVVHFPHQLLSKSRISSPRRTMPLAALHRRAAAQWLCLVFLAALAARAAGHADDAPDNCVIYRDDDGDDDGGNEVLFDLRHLFRRHVAERCARRAESGEGGERSKSGF